MDKPSEDHLSSGACAHGQLQGQTKEATAAKIGMGKLLLLIVTIITAGIIILPFDLISCLTLFTESDFLGVRYAKYAEKRQTLPRPFRWSYLSASGGGLAWVEFRGVCIW